jgi:hypothetical protein
LIKISFFQKKDFRRKTNTFLDVSKNGTSGKKNLTCAVRQRHKWKKNSHLCRSSTAQVEKKFALVPFINGTSGKKVPFRSKNKQFLDKRCFLMKK